MSASKTIGGVGLFGKSLGVVADVLDALRLGFLKLQEWALRAFGSIINGALRANKALVAVVNTIPGVEIQASTFLQALSDEMGGAAAAAKKRFDDAWTAPPPSARINAFFDDVQKRAEEAAAAVTALNAGKPGGTPGGGLAGGLLGRMLGAGGKFMENDLGVKIGKQLYQGMAQAVGGLDISSLMGGAALALAPAAKLDDEAVSVGSLPISAQGPLSREGFSQRVRSLQQGAYAKEDKVQQKQLGKLESIAANIAKIAARQPIEFQALEL